MRIVTRPDLDGVVCAVLLYEAEDIAGPVLWVEPRDIQNGLADIGGEDILANLPYDDRCAMWFDHHLSNQASQSFEGVFRIAPSAAGLIHQYYRDRYKRDFTELVAATDKIDSADLSEEEVHHPESNPYFLLSITISGRADKEADYWVRLIELLRHGSIRSVLSDKEVKERCKRTIEESNAYEGLLEKHTRVTHHVSITDFRELDRTPHGNRFMVYSLLPETNVNVRILDSEVEKDAVIVKVGHSIFKRTCKVNVGKMLSDFGGGGHRGAGSCSLPRNDADRSIEAIVGILVRNEEDE